MAVFTTPCYPVLSPKAAFKYTPITIGANYSPSTNKFSNQQYDIYKFEKQVVKIGNNAIADVRYQNDFANGSSSDPMDYGVNTPSLSDIGTALSVIGESMWLFGEIRSSSLYKEGLRSGLSGNYQLTGRNLSLFNNLPMTALTKPSTGWTTFGNGLSNFGTGVALAGTVVDTYQYSKGDLSGAKYSYHLAGTGTSIGAFYFLGGPYGAVAGGLFFLSEKAWDMTQPTRDEISRKYWQFENALTRGWRLR